MVLNFLTLGFGRVHLCQFSSNRKPSFVYAQKPFLTTDGIIFGHDIFYNQP